MHSFFSSAIIVAVVLPPVAIGTLDQALQVNDQIFAQQFSALSQRSLPDGMQLTVSNVLKTKHDTVKNSINNVR
jgi:hypothetical protein